MYYSDVNKNSYTAPGYFFNTLCFLAAFILLACVVVGIGHGLNPVLIVVAFISFIPSIGIIRSRNLRNLWNSPLILFVILTFVGYFVNYLAFTFDDDLIDPTLNFCSTPLRDSVASGYLPKALQAALVGYTFILFGTWASLSINVPGVTRQPLARRSPYILAYFICMTLHLMITYIKVHLGLGVMGAELEVLPYHLGGILVRTDEVLLPFVMLITICFAKYSGKTNSYIWGVIMYVAYFAVVGIVNASKGMVIIALVKLLLCVLLFDASNALKTNAMKKKTKGVWVMIMVGVLFTGFHDMTAEFRELRKTNEIVQSLTKIDSGYNLIGGIKTTTLRVTGINSLVQCVYKSDPKVDDIFNNIEYYFLSDREFDRIYTSEVEEIESNTHSSAPSLIGGLYLVGGYPLLCVGCFFAPFSFTLIQWFVRRNIFYGAAAYYASASIMLMLLLVEGSLGYFGQLLIILIPAIFLSEWIIRILYSPTRVRLMI